VNNEEQQEIDFPAVIAQINEIIEKATGVRMPFALVIHKPPGSMIAGNVPEVAMAKMLEAAHQGLVAKIGRDAINAAALAAMNPDQSRPN
jgi:hypothetical protein